MIVKYRTIKSDHGVMSDKLLKEIGLEEWHLGGVAQIEEDDPHLDPHGGVGYCARRTVFYYHFWKEVEVS